MTSAAPERNDLINKEKIPKKYLDKIKVEEEQRLQELLAAVDKEFPHLPKAVIRVGGRVSREQPSGGRILSTLKEGNDAIKPLPKTQALGRTGNLGIKAILGRKNVFTGWETDWDEGLPIWRHSWLIPANLLSLQADIQGAQFPTVKSVEVDKESIKGIEEIRDEFMRLRTAARTLQFPDFKSRSKSTPKDLVTDISLLETNIALFSEAIAPTEKPDRREMDEFALTQLRDEKMREAERLIEDKWGTEAQRKSEQAINDLDEFLRKIQKTQEEKANMNRRATYAREEIKKHLEAQRIWGTWMITLMETLNTDEDASKKDAAISNGLIAFEGRLNQAEALLYGVLSLLTHPSTEEVPVGIRHEAAKLLKRFPAQEYQAVLEKDTKEFSDGHSTQRKTASALLRSLDFLTIPLSFDPKATERKSKMSEAKWAQNLQLGALINEGNTANFATFVERVLIHFPETAIHLAIMFLTQDHLRLGGLEILRRLPHIEDAAQLFENSELIAQSTGPRNLDSAAQIDIGLDRPRSTNQRILEAAGLAPDRKNALEVVEAQKRAIDEKDRQAKRLEDELAALRQQLERTIGSLKKAEAENVRYRTGIATEVSAQVSSQTGEIQRRATEAIARLDRTTRNQGIRIAMELLKKDESQTVPAALIRDIETITDFTEGLLVDWNGEAGNGLRTILYGLKEKIDAIAVILRHTGKVPERSAFMELQEAIALLITIEEYALAPGESERGRAKLTLNTKALLKAKIESSLPLGQEIPPKRAHKK